MSKHTLNTIHQILEYCFIHNYQLFTTLNVAKDIPDMVTHHDQLEILYYNKRHYVEILGLNKQEQDYVFSHLDFLYQVKSLPKKSE